MNCPRCEGETLAPFTVKELTLDRCRSCAGVWFDKEELSELLNQEAEQLKQLLKSNLSDQAEGKKGRCPRDGSELMRVYSAIDRSVVLDVCGECGGVWLDSGEFKRLFAALRT